MLKTRGYRVGKEGILQIAEAIKKNGLEQARGTYVEYGMNHVPISACALGQAYVNLKDSYSNGNQVRLYLNNFYRVGGCPAPGHIDFGQISAYSLGDLVTHLNDWHKWKFSSIARFLVKEANTL